MRVHPYLIQVVKRRVVLGNNFSYWFQCIRGFWPTVWGPARGNWASRWETKIASLEGKGNSWKEVWLTEGSPAIMGRWYLMVNPSLASGSWDSILVEVVGWPPGPRADPTPKRSAAILCPKQIGYSKVGRSARLPSLGWLGILQHPCVGSGPCLASRAKCDCLPAICGDTELHRAVFLKK